MSPASEIEIFDALRVYWEATEDDLLEAYRDSADRHQCPGDDVRGCGVNIPIERERCHFCRKTIRLREEGHVIG